MENQIISKSKDGLRMQIVEHIKTESGRIQSTTKHLRKNDKGKYQDCDGNIFKVKA